MDLYTKIKTIYPALLARDFIPGTGTIVLQNDGQGDYIAVWTHELQQPTQEQLDGVN